MSEPVPSITPEATDAPIPAPTAPSSTDVASMFDLSKKKKKKKKKEVKDAIPSETIDIAPIKDAIGMVQDPAMYSYEQELLTRIMTKLHENNPELSDRKRHTMKPPQLMRVGTKKTLWVNFQEICQMMHRNPDHVLQFTLTELGTEGSIDGNQRLVIRGRYVPKYIESVLRKYITEYVTCQMCRSPNTTLTRDSVSRLYFVHCQESAPGADRRAARK
uniref:Eukaryotic translation initiation factor 2 subunit beta putative n=1 Tax=Albugo laibachii Nc14 TaxID=890382 RepID=F0WLK9_9STRA|nr:eukaryotic translation initiation factor 2 subunit beta putative [Albugo laibachii Nc14]|eukprot:CCA22173.1 eukaryotic translation initiation factor 2 subunit beta putative [Albugo laibachii Nc14]